MRTSNFIILVTAIPSTLSAQWDFTPPPDVDMTQPGLCKGSDFSQCFEGETCHYDSIKELIGPAYQYYKIPANQIESPPGQRNILAFSVLIPDLCNTVQLNKASAILSLGPNPGITETLYVDLPFGGCVTKVAGEESCLWLQVAYTLAGVTREGGAPCKAEGRPRTVEIAFPNVDNRGGLGFYCQHGAQNCSLAPECWGTLPPE